jgi:hydrogenase expression/formation protein HypE
MAHELTSKNSLARQCGLPHPDSDERITLAHGEGGRLARRFLRERIFARFPSSQGYDDAALLGGMSGPVIFATDSYVVTPLFFPGGDIGRLAVCGTVNDLLVRGATPRFLSLALIIEEGLSLKTLESVLDSIVVTAKECDVRIVTGDTKVVPRSAADGLFLNTAGVGEALHPLPPGPSSLQPGDCLLVTGPIGRHGVAVLAAREQIAFDPPPTSDCAPLTAAVDALRAQGIVPRALRDATRGGVAAVLHEWAEECRRTLVIEESRLPVTPDVRGACELLGLDPLHLANEGTMVVAVEQDRATAALAALRATGVARQACIIGQVSSFEVAPVVVRRLLGREQPLDDPHGAPLPRIC